MIVAGALLGYALLLAVAGPRLLTRRGWAERAPRLGIIAWQSLTATVLAAVALAGLALVMPTVRVSADLANLLQACVMALRAQYATPGGAAAGATGAVLALAVLGRAGYCLIATVTVAVRGRSLIVRRPNVRKFVQQILVWPDAPRKPCEPANLTFN